MVVVVWVPNFIIQQHPLKFDESWSISCTFLISMNQFQVGFMCFDFWLWDAHLQVSGEGYDSKDCCAKLIVVWVPNFVIQQHQTAFTHVWWVMIHLLYISDLHEPVSGWFHVFWLLTVRCPLAGFWGRIWLQRLLCKTHSSMGPKLCHPTTSNSIHPCLIFFCTFLISMNQKQISFRLSYKFSMRDDWFLSSSSPNSQTITPWTLQLLMIVIINGFGWVKPGSIAH